MLSSTDDDDDASWSNLGTDLQGEEIVLEDVVGKKKTKEEFEEGDEKELEEKPQMTCGKKDDSPPSKEEEEKELEGIEDAWEGARTRGKAKTRKCARGWNSRRRNLTRGRRP